MEGSARGSRQHSSNAISADPACGAAHRITHTHTHTHKVLYAGRAYCYRVLYYTVASICSALPLASVRAGIVPVRGAKPPNTPGIFLGRRRCNAHQGRSQEATPRAALLRNYCSSGYVRVTCALAALGNTSCPFRLSASLVSYHRGFIYNTSNRPPIEYLRVIIKNGNGSLLYEIIQYSTVGK